MTGPVLNAAVPPASAVSVRDARAIAGRCFGLVPRDVRPLDGERDRNFLLRDGERGDVVLKFVDPEEDAAVTDFVSRLLLHVAAADPELPVPRIVRPRSGAAPHEVRHGPGGQVCRVRCVTYLHGRPLQTGLASPAQRRSLGAFLARLDRALAGFAHPADDHDLLWDLKRAARVRPLLAAVRDPELRGLVERVLDRFESDVAPRLPELRRQVIHNDFNPQNVLVSLRAPGEIAGVIDFGDAIRAPLIQDVATACAYQVPSDGHPLEAAAQIASGFDSVLALREEELSILAQLIATRLAMSVAISSWRAAIEPRNARYVLRNQRAVQTSLRRLAELPDDDGAAGRLAEQIGRG